MKLFSCHSVLEATIAAVLEKYLPGAFLAAVSGGADSTAMLVVLAALRDQGFFIDGAFNLHCIHVEHGIRLEAESKGDAEFVRSLCEKLCVPCKIVSIKPGEIATAAKNLGLGIEATARLYRRKAWFRELARIKKQHAENNTSPPVRILTAHTADDMLETVLMRVLRGSGPSGLGAMPVSRGRILRPLITLSRSEVIDYLTEKGIAWREDSTNTNVQFLRNRIRHRLIPNLDEHFPQWRDAIAALGETQSLAAEFVKDEVTFRIKWGVGNGEKKGTKRFLSTDAVNFFAQPAIIREEALFQGINKLGLPAKIKRKNIRRFAERKVAAVDLGSLQIRRDSQRVMIVATTKKGNYEGFSIPHSSFLIPHFSEKGFSLLIIAPGSYNLKGIDIKVEKCGYSKEGTPSLDNRCPVSEGGSEKAFLAVLPLVLRPYFKDDRIVNERKMTPLKGGFPGQISSPAVITAADTLGPVAFIGINGGRYQLLQRRDDGVVLQQVPFDDDKRCVVCVTINVNGGLDV